MYHANFNYEQKEINIVTVAEARKRLKIIKPWLNTLTDYYLQFTQLSSELIRISKGKTPIEDILSVKFEVDSIDEELIIIRDYLAELDCVIKDWKTGLVDFIGVRKNQQIWLCYKKGEGTLNYYHGWDDGFASRKQIDFE